MEFYLELSNRINTFRLQRDGSWRRVGQPEDLREEDFASQHVFELIRLQRANTTVTVDGTTYDVRPERGGDRDTLYYNVLVQRDIFPLTPSKEQLRSVIRQGDDRVTNSLILNVYGFFELRDFYTMDIHTDDPTLVFRYETFGEGNGYVGEESANDNNYIDDLYTTFLEGWLGHLRHGTTNMYFGAEAAMGEDELLATINRLGAQWVREVDQE